MEMYLLVTVGFLLLIAVMIFIAAQSRSGRKGTDEPWKYPEVRSQDPSLPPPKDHDLETWKKSNTH